MSTTDKSQIVLDFIKTCPYLTSATLFFNFGNVEDGAYQAITKSDDVSLQKPYVDGSVAKRYTLSIDCFKSVSYNPVVTSAGDENLAEFKDVQQVLDWINAQDDLENYPNFGTDYLIDEMKTLTSRPELLSVDTQNNPPMAIYRITIQIDYLDNTKRNH